MLYTFLLSNWEFTTKKESDLSSYFDYNNDAATWCGFCFISACVEELHGKLDEERFLFSQGNESAAYDVLDLTEVISVFDCSAG